MSNIGLSTRREALTGLGAFLALALVPRGLSALGRKPFPHPEPRSGISGAAVLAADQLPDRKPLRAAFEYARSHPQTFDGVYCVCECADNMQHRSLLACFESRQPVGCSECQAQAYFVGQRARHGKTLAEIRDAVDKKWGD